MGVILRAHPVRGESHIQRNANVEFVTIACLWYSRSTLHICAACCSDSQMELVV